MQDAAQTFESFLRRRGLSLTRQREQILRVFLDREGHRSADEIAALVRAANPGIGMATIYRTLKLLVESGLADEHRFGSDATLYEPSHSHHEHMICLACDDILEFEDDELEALKARIAAAHGFKMIRHTLQFYGVCAACQAAGRAPRGGEGEHGAG
jgi:Fur family ferric uptake transcriptional regulator